MSIEVLMFLALASGFAGFVDAMAGGGGLIQLPALLIGLPNKELPLILGTNKVPSIFGTAAAARNYFKNIKPDIPLTVSMMGPAFIGSITGAAFAATVPKDFFKPLFLFKVKINSNSFSVSFVLTPSLTMTLWFESIS